MLPPGQRMVERDIHATVAVLDIEHHGIPADFAPMFDDAYPVVTSGHHAGQIDCAYFKILSHRNGLLDDGRRQNSRHYNLLARLQVVARPAAICLTDRLRQFARSKVGCPLHVLPRQRPHAVPPFGFVQFRARWSECRMHIHGLRRDGCRRSAAAYDFWRLLRDRMRHRYRRPVENDQDQCKEDPEGKGGISKTAQSFLPEVVLGRILPRVFCAESYVGPEPHSLPTVERKALQRS